MRGVLPVLSAGCVTSTVNVLEESLDFDGEVSSLVVTVPAGDLTVEVGAVARAELSRTLRWTGDEPAVAAWLEGSVLNVDVDCRSSNLIVRPAPLVQMTCEVDHVLRLPAPASLWAELGSGSIGASDLVGAVDVLTNEGDVDLTRVDGPIVASSGKGVVRVEDVTGTLSLDSGTGDLVVIGASAAEILATSGSGNVDLELVTRPAQVTVDSGSGDIAVSVPSGTYRIDAATGSGEVWISGVSADDGADAVLDLETGRGNIGIEGR